MQHRNAAADTFTLTLPSPCFLFPSPQAIYLHVPLCFTQSLELAKSIQSGFTPLHVQWISSSELFSFQLYNTEAPEERLLISLRL